MTAVIKDSRVNTDPTARQVLRQETCNASLVKFSGGAPVGLLAVGNPVALVDDPLNSTRIVCLMHLRTDGDGANLPINYTLQGKLKGAAAFKYTFCVDKVAKGFNIVKCSEPHVGQTTGGYLSGRYVDKFPGDAHLIAQRAQQCPPLAQAFLGTKSRADIKQDGLYVTKTAWAQGDRYAACFVKVTSGTVKKSLQGIGDKPLTSYR
ncbi:septum formation family protein [Allobranchiibius sp. CTAmp26]|uniref:septum formation family protein n=1 Tax=Allobranchiibius sp. CTAmp26 TaxID=2815214 RepID=UPI001AA13DBB|nr:septum formation family protein [Allobranchiibius sp. CTAmp26]MBO1755941.1 septum formation family protein [Allobranchiibius sp. CTAmp26]